MIRDAVMNDSLPQLFRSEPPWLIGVVHLLPLPGSPRWAGDLQAIWKRAVDDANAYRRGGAHALVIENFGDLPFTKGSVPPETIAAMAQAAAAIRRAVSLPIGFNVLRNDVRAGLGLCSACDGQFVRVNVHTGAMLTDQGVIEGKAFETLRGRAALCPKTKIFADVQVKHAVPLAPQPIGQSARDTLERGLADALIVSGTGTGLATDLADVRAVREACPAACILIGSGIAAQNIGRYLPYADGFIVGSSLKHGGAVDRAVDARRVAELRRAMTRPPARKPK
jgi:uncharacterized protein